MIQFSVLISVYFGESGGNLSKALASIVEQTLQPTEIVLVKDGPLKPEVELIISEYISRYSFFKVVTLQKNLGLGEALRAGLDACSFEIVARMDSDDISCKNRFELQVPYLNSHTEISVLGANIEEFEVVPGDIGRVKRVPYSFKRIKSYSKCRCPVNHPTAVFRKTAIISAGSYRDMSFFEDYYLWVRVINKGFIIENIPVNVLYFRVSKKMMERRHGMKYFRKELRFFNALKNESLISFSRYILLIISRLPFRLLPKKISFGFYHHFLRQ